MAEVIRMPLLSDTMKEGVISEWHKKVGDSVKSDEVLADVETDKATMEVIGYVPGTLLYIGVEKGKSAKVNEIIAIVGKPGENYQSLLEQDKKGTQGSVNTSPVEGSATLVKEQVQPAPGPSEDSALREIMKKVTVIRMPLLSDTMKEGKILAWNKKIGDKVKSDDVLAEVETDKATMEVTAYANGSLLYLGTQEGKAAKVNDIIAIVGQPGTDIKPVLDAESNRGMAKPESQSDPTAGRLSPSAETPSSVQVHSLSNGRIKASPLAKKLAADKGIDLNQVVGTGDTGRIIRRDIDSFIPGKEKPIPIQVATTPSVQSALEGFTDTPVSQIRKIIALRLTESKNSAPHFYLTIEVNMDRAVQARAIMNEVSPVKISFNDFIIKAAAMALRMHPQVNSSWLGDYIRTHHHIHIGSAVAIEDGLIVPVIRFADQKSLAQIASETRNLNEKAKNKKLQPQEFSGNTFTISNLGMLDIEEFTAIINPPDACILAVGRIKPSPVVIQDQVKVAQIMKMTMSCDHRVVDGAVGALFLQSLKRLLEDPVIMLV